MKFLPLFLLLTVSSVFAQETQNLTTPTDNAVITTNVTLKPGTYVLKQGLIIGADNITIDGNGASLIGFDNTGKGITINGHKNITITNLTIERFRWGIYAKDCDTIQLNKVNSHRTAEIEPGDTFLNIWIKAEAAYGAGVMFWKVKNSSVSNCDFQHQQNGLMMYDCEKMVVEKSNMSFNSGWGIHMNKTTDSEIRNNVADFCIRIQERGRYYYHAGADASGLTMVVGSSRNKIIGNKLRGGGDGVFVAGFHDSDLIAPCNDNLFENNDCSLSPNNAFELTFCENNIFRNNKANDSNYGFWLGYSQKNLIEDNVINNNRIAGIAIEHGYDSIIQKNSFYENRDGILLWTDGKNETTKLFPKNAGSYKYVITENLFFNNRYGIRSFTGNEVWGLVHTPGQMFCYDYTISENTFYGNRAGIHFLGVKDCVIKNNKFNGNIEADMQLLDSVNIKAGDNETVKYEQIKGINPEPIP